MRRPLVILAAAAAAVAVAVPAGAGSTTQILIRHQVKGCHTWSVNGGPFRAFQSIHLARGTVVTVTNNDMMPHTLIQLGGPKLALHAALMGHMMASTRIAFRTPGTYVFKTKAGEDYPMMAEPKTTGEDNVLRLRVVVK